MAADIEEPAYRLIETIGPVELRRYEPTIQAQTVLGSSNETSSGFRRLAAFIFGENDESAKIAMTAPVTETLTERQPVMAFTMPASYSMQDLPRPNDRRIALREVPARTLAVIRFSGWATGSRVANKREELLATLAAHGIQPTGELALNQYNPPWTLPFLRRNEVVVEVDSASVATARD
ncbi:MAG: heme-binding protein [Halioglobus sp.]